MAYVDGYVIPVPHANKEAYHKLAHDMVALFKEFGAIDIVECWGDDIPKGELTDFFKAVQAKDDEGVVFSWMIWPSKEARDAGWAKMQTDERFAEHGPMPFDGKRMFFGGFEPIVGL